MLLRIENLHVRYGGIAALSGISIDVPEGDCRFGMGVPFEVPLDRAPVLRPLRLVVSMMLKVFQLAPHAFLVTRHLRFETENVPNTWFWLPRLPEHLARIDQLPERMKRRETQIQSGSRFSVFACPEAYSLPARTPN